MYIFYDRLVSLLYILDINMPHPVRPLPFKPPRLRGISPAQIDSLYENQYGPAVQRLNDADTRPEIVGDSGSESRSGNFHRLRNTVTRYEAHFSGLGEHPGQPRGEVDTAIKARFRSYDEWCANLISLLPGDTDGYGWLMLTWSTAEAALQNLWLEFEEDQPEKLVSVVVISVHPDAYEKDFGTDIAGYVQAYLGNVDWEVAERLIKMDDNEADAASDYMPSKRQISVEALAGLLKSGNPPVVLDVRLAQDIRPGDTRILGSTWLDPEQVDRWGKELPADRPVIVYCMYGFRVSRDTTATLINLGINAKFLGGGISTWRALGSPVESVD
jgi:Fe-Mn family superoxide dismutase